MPITGSTPLLLKRPNNKIDVMTIEDMVRNDKMVFQPTHELDFCTAVAGWEVWSGNEFTPVNAIRQLNNEFRDTVRLCNVRGCVDLGANSLLLTTDNDIMRVPVESCSISREFQYSCPDRNTLKNICHEKITKDSSHFMGQWMRLAQNYPFEHYNSDTTMKRIYPPINNIIGCFTGRNQLKVPVNILNSAIDPRTQFIRSFFKTEQGVANGACAAQGVLILARSIGQGVLLHNEVVKSRKSLYCKDRYTMSLHSRRSRMPNEKTTFYKVEKSRMPVRHLYTLETGVGNFAAGVGGVVIKY